MEDVLNSLKQLFCAVLFFAKKQKNYLKKIK